MKKRGERGGRTAAGCGERRAVGRVRAQAAGAAHRRRRPTGLTAHRNSPRVSRGKGTAHDRAAQRKHATSGAEVRGGRHALHAGTGQCRFRVTLASVCACFASVSLVEACRRACRSSLPLLSAGGAVWLRDTRTSGEELGEERRGGDPSDERTTATVGERERSLHARGAMTRDA